jgi:hypothetical protein
MKDSHSADPQQRIDALRRSGRLEPTDAATLREAFPPQDPAPQPAATPAQQRFPDFSRVFLGGAMDEATLRRLTLQRSVLMGAMFAFLFFFSMVLVTGWSRFWPHLVTVWSPLSLFAGAMFGLSMHLVVMRPMVERLVRLRREAGSLQPLGLVDAGQCPTCRAEDFTVWTWRHPMMLHWIANPGLAFNELVLGQRMPARANVCRQCRTSFVDCPHCNRAIDAVQWGGRSALGHWRGLPCPHCGGSIPVLSNALAFLVKAPIRGMARLLGVGGAR